MPPEKSKPQLCERCNLRRATTTGVAGFKDDKVVRSRLCADCAKLLQPSESQQLQEMFQQDSTEPGNLMQQSHGLPNGTWVTLQVERDYPHSEWTNFLLLFHSGRIHPSWYRVFLVGTPPPKWRRMKSAGAVYTQMGIGDADSDKPVALRVGDDDSDKDAQEALRENVGKTGAAGKLPKGRYVLQAKVRVEDKDVELTSIEFEVFRSPWTVAWG